MNKELKRTIILIVGIVVTVILIRTIQGFDKTGRQLKDIGYSKEERTQIQEKLNKDDLNKILNMEYHDNLVDIINHKYFIPKNLEKYLEYDKDNVDDIISIINVGANKDWYTDPIETDISKGNSMLVNKFNHLNDDYDPDDIVNISIQYAYEGHKIKKEVYSQYVKMWNDAKKQDLTLIVNSSYRTFEQQKKEYDNSNDDYAARPGFSEHQTGLTLDIVTYNTVGNDFENTDEFKWLQDNAHKYGFILRYPKDKEYLTGYHYESWHYRYLGIDLATKVYESGLTYDEYYAYYCDYKGEC